VTGPLEGARWKIKRAWEHLASVDAETAAFFNMRPYVLDTEPDGENRWRVFIRVRQEPPAHLAVGFADAVHSIRSALDYIAAALTTSKGERVAQWPIYDSPDVWDRFHKKHLNGIDGAYYASIRARQPFSDPSKLGGLTVLRELDDADKHRMLQLAIPWPSQLQVEIPTGLSVVDNVSGPIYVENRTVVFWLTGTPAPNVPMEIKSVVGYRVSFGAPPQSTNTVGLLDISYTVLEIIDCFEAMIRG
jgi:hypothetical protein